jgi:hypothetical protein
MVRPDSLLLFGELPAAYASRTLDSATLEDPTRRYGCGIGSCKRRFTRLEHAQRHRTIHTQEKSFGCDQCGKAFARKDNADAHVSTGSIDCARTTATS